MWFLFAAFMTHSGGNGAAPVYVVASGRLDKAAPVRVHTHYHGDHATALQGEHMSRIEELLSADPQRIFVLPEAAATGAPTNWRNVTDQARTTDDALRDFGVAAVEAYTVSAHSSGGRALAAAFERRAVRAHRVVLLDCLYQPAAGRILRGLLTSPAEVIVVRATNPEGRTARFAAALGTDVIVFDDHEATVRYALDGYGNVERDPRQARQRNARVAGAR